MDTGETRRIPHIPRRIQAAGGPAALPTSHAESRRLSQEKKCRLIVVPLDRKDWDDHALLEQELKKLQTASWNAQPVMDFKTQAKGWLEVENAIRKVVLTLRERRD